MTHIASSGPKLVSRGARLLRRSLGYVSLAWLVGAAIAQDPPTSRPAFREMVQKQERSVGFVRGQGYHTSVRSGPNGEERLGESFARFLFEAAPGGRFRVDFEPQTSPWYQERTDAKPRCFLERTVSSGYDGSTSWLWEQASMEEGKPETTQSLRSAQVEARRNSVRQVCPASAWRITLPGFYSDRGMSFAEGLEITEAPYDLAWDAAREEIVLSLPARDGSTIERWYLPRRWAYCLGRYEVTETATGRVKATREVLEAIKLHDLFWYPTRASSRSAVGDGDIVDRTETHLATVEVASPDPAEFQPRFPGGTRVTDLLTGEAVNLAAPDAILGRELSAQAKELRELVRYEADPELPWLRMALGALLVVTAAGIVMKRRRGVRARRRHARGQAATTAMGAILMVGLAAPTSAQAPWVMQSLPEATIDNCGLNAAALVAAFFSRAAVLETLAHDLGCGERRHEAVALADLEFACRGLGLETKAFQQATLRDAVAAAGKRQGIAVVMVATDAAVAHYFVVTPGKQGLVIANPGVSVRECAWSDAYACRISDRFTGLGVVVWQSGDGRERLIVDGASWQVPLSELSGEAIVVRNTSGSAVRLESVRTSCGCIGGAELTPSKLESGATGGLRLRIDIGRLGESAGNQQAVLVFRGASSTFAVTVDMAIARRREPPIAKPGLTPSLVSGTNASGACSGAIDVVVPTGGRVTEWRLSSGVTTEPRGVFPITGGVLCSYTVNWSGRPGWLQVAVADGVGTITTLSARLEGVGRDYEVR